MEMLIVLVYFSMYYLSVYLIEMLANPLFSIQWWYHHYPFYCSQSCSNEEKNDRNGLFNQIYSLEEKKTKKISTSVKVILFSCSNEEKLRYTKRLDKQLSISYASIVIRLAKKSLNRPIDKWKCRSEKSLFVGCNSSGRKSDKNNQRREKNER